MKVPKTLTHRDAQCVPLVAGTGSPLDGGGGVRL